MNLSLATLQRGLVTAACLFVPTTFALAGPPATAAGPAEPHSEAVVGLTLNSFGGTYHAGSVLSLGYDAIGDVRQPDAKLRAELSNARGSFARPTVLGTAPLGEAGAGVVAVKLPRTLKAGRAYRVRLVRTDLPAQVGAADNGQNLVLTPAPRGGRAVLATVN